MDKTPDPGLPRGSPVIPLTPVSGLRTPRRTGPSSPSSPSSWDSISVLFVMPLCPEHWLAVPQDAPHCGFVGSPSDGAQSGHASEAGTPRKLCTEGPLLLPLTVPCTPDPATSWGLPEASEHLWAQDTGARLQGQPGIPPGVRCLRRYAQNLLPCSPARAEGRPGGAGALPRRAAAPPLAPRALEPLPGFSVSSLPGLPARAAAIHHGQMNTVRSGEPRPR